MKWSIENYLFQTEVDVCDLAGFVACTRKITVNITDINRIDGILCGYVHAAGDERIDFSKEVSEVYLPKECMPDLSDGQTYTFEIKGETLVVSRSYDLKKTIENMIEASLGKTIGVTVFSGEDNSPRTYTLS